MNTKQIFAALTILGIVLLAPMSRAADITATGSGNWSSTVPDAPWPDGIVPNPTNDDVDVEAPFNITVDSYAQIQYIYGSGTVTMAPGSTLNVVGDSTGAQGTFQLAVLDTSAAGNTVIYSGNSFWAKHQNYCNLVFSNTTTNTYDFYNGLVNSQDPAFAMTITGDLSMFGKVRVQQGADITIGGNLIMGTNGYWDCSSFNLTVTSNLTIGGLMIDLDGALGSNYFGGNVILTSFAVGWNLTDVTQWAIGGSLTNNAFIAGVGYGSISFDGTGVITGKVFTVPTITVNGTYTIGTTITLLTNTPTLNGTLVFDIAKTNRIVLKSYPANPLTFYYSGNLDVINSGAEPAAGSSFKFFTATNFDGTFASTSFPSLSGGKNWVDNLVASGSIAVIGASIGSPTISMSRSGPVLTLSWDSTAFPGYRVLAQTNNAGLGTNWSNTGSGTVSPFTTTINPANPAVFYRLANP